MIRSRFLWKLYAGYVLVVLLTTAVVGTLVAWSLRESWLDETETTLRNKATLLSEIAAPALASGDTRALAARLRALGHGIDARLTVIAADGTVVADSEEDPAHMANHHDRPEVLGARSHGLGRATRRSETLGVSMMYVAVAVRDGDRLLGYTRSALPLTRFDLQLHDLRQPLLIGIGAAAVLALAIGLFVSWKITSPIGSMTAAADAIARGDFEQRLPATAHDELGALSRSFNAMGEELERRMTTILSDRNKMLAILASMVEGVIAVDRDERITHANDAAGRMIGAPAEEAIGRRVWEVTRVQAVNDAIARAIREVAHVRAEARIVGETRDRVIEVNASPLRDGGGGAAGAVVVLHDVTELRRLEEVRREFVANVSHELKTPLTAIRGLVETLVDDEEMEAAKTAHFHGRILDQTNRLSALVNDLITLSRLESETIPVERAPVDLAALVRESARFYAPLAEAKGVPFEAAVPEGPLVAQADAKALAQAIDNLLDNAIKYTPPGRQVGVRLRADGGAGVVEVRDEGIGIEPLDQPRIFERFYRVDRGRSREMGGTGLGLSIVKHVARAHGGSISVTSAVGQGSVFELRIPLVGRAA